MAALREKAVLAKTRAESLDSVKTLNCWGSNLEDVRKNRTDERRREMVNLFHHFIGLIRITVGKKVYLCYKVYANCLIFVANLRKQTKSVAMLPGIG